MISHQIILQDHEYVNIYEVSVDSISLLSENVLCKIQSPGSPNIVEGSALQPEYTGEQLNKTLLMLTDYNIEVDYLIKRETGTFFKVQKREHAMKRTANEHFKGYIVRQDDQEQFEGL